MIFLFLDSRGYTSVCPDGDDSLDGVPEDLNLEDLGR
jgi:hypothetical protein